MTNFFYFFNESDFEAGCEFTSDFLSNIYSKIYLPGNDIVVYGEEFNDLVMVQESVVTLNLRIDQHKMFHDKNQSLDFIPGQGPKMIEFFILPAYSYFGDY